MIIQLWNTGVSEKRQPLPGGAHDPHWTVIGTPRMPPPPPNQAPAPGQPAYVLNDQKSYNPYFATTDSRWIWINADGTPDVSRPTGFYVFQTFFHIEADVSHNWVEIAGAWGVDNFGHLTIDRIALPSFSLDGEISLLSGNLTTNYSLPHSFSISTAHTRSRSPLQLDQGWHTLEAWVANEGPVDKDKLAANPAGLNVTGLQLSVNQNVQVPRRPRF